MPEDSEGILNRKKVSENAAADLRAKFGSREYAQKYYPDHINVAELLSISKKVADIHESQSLLNTEEISRELGVSHETIENVALLDFQRMIVRTLLARFPRGDARVLDVGGGPTIYQHIFMSLVAGHITHAEYLESNREEVSKWLRDAADSLKWDAYFDLSRKMLQADNRYTSLLFEQEHSEDGTIAQHARMIRGILEEDGLTGFKALVRERIGDDVVHGDMFKEDLGLGARGTAFDVVTSYFVMESVASDKTFWETGMHNTLSRVRPGGYHIQAAVRNTEWWEGGMGRLPATKINENDIREACKTEGFAVIEQRILRGTDLAVAGYDGMIFTFAQKV